LENQWFMSEDFQVLGFFDGLNTRGSGRGTQPPRR
jgi:hypothetical protein